MNETCDSIRDVGVRLICVSERIRREGVSVDTASTLENAADAIRAHAAGERQALHARAVLEAAEHGDA